MCPQLIGGLLYVYLRLVSHLSVHNMVYIIYQIVKLSHGHGTMLVERCPHQIAADLHAHEISACMLMSTDDDDDDADRL